MRHIRGQYQRINVTEKIDFKSLIGERRLSRYYRYDGSLTTPPCFETVLWTVVVDPIPISLRQLHAFRYLHDDSAHLIENTYRKVQKLGSRLLFRSFNSDDSELDIEQRSLVTENHAFTFQTNNQLVLTFLVFLVILSKPF